MTRCLIHPIKKNVKNKFMITGLEFYVCDFCFKELSSNDRCHKEVKELAIEIIEEKCERILYRGTENKIGEG